MAEDYPPRITVSASATVRQRPSVLLMTIPLQVTEPTLELGLARLKKQSEATLQWLQRLNAVRVEVGEPHFASQTATDPMKMVRAAAARAMGKAAPASSDESGRRVCVVVTAQWDIATMSAEQVLVFVDRLRFEAAQDAGSTEPAESPPAWSSPEEQLQSMMAQMAAPAANDPTPQILFIARLGSERMEKACAEAMSQAERDAERLARGAGRQLGKLVSFHFTADGLLHLQPHKMMERQRCLGLLADSSYDFRNNEVVSDDPRAAEFTLTVNATFQLE